LSPPAATSERARSFARLEAGLLVLAFLSGAAALAYEVSWARALSLTIGSTTLASSAVVAGFMGGMGLGAWILHRVQRRVGSALGVYAGLELGIAVTTALITRTFVPLPELFAGIASLVAPVWLLDLIRIALAFALVVVPAMLMGATYPALCLVVIRSSEGVDRLLGLLYGLNTLGAALGALVTGVFLLEPLGLQHTVTAANALNLAIGAAALVLARRESVASNAGMPDPEPIPTSLPGWIVGAVLFGSGFCTLAYEMVWFRALRYVVGNSTYALTVVLVVFLLGLGAGAVLLRPVLRRRAAERALAETQIAIALLAVAAISLEYVVLASPGLEAHVSAFSSLFLEHRWWLRLLVHGALATSMMLPATLMMGLSFPLATRLLLGNVRRLGQRVGLAYLLANLGSILGSILAAIWVLPVLGTVAGTCALAAANLGLGLLVARHLAGARVPRGVVVASAGAMVGVALLLPARLPFSGADLAYLKGGILMQEEGDLATVQVRADRVDPSARGMLIDGVLIGVSGSWFYPIYEKQLMVAHLPMALDPTIRSTLNVGLGSASTLYQLSRYPSIDRLDVVEINQGVVEGARLFEQGRVLDDPRVHVVVEDAVHYLIRSRRSYDLIISDGKQNADFSGTARILSLEFYRQSRAHLGSTGLFVQAIPFATAPEDFRIILRTLAAAFPHYEVFVDPPLWIFMVASSSPIAGRDALTDARLAALPVRTAYQELAFPTVDSLLATWAASRSQILSVLGTGPINDWDHLPLEFDAYRSRGSGGTENLELLLRARDAGPSPAAEQYAPRASPVVVAREEGWRAFVDYLQGRRGRAFERLDAALRDHPKDPWVARVLLNFRR
jgi:spermidine synthase